MSDDINRMDVKEFREEGYLAEVNRRVLHPLGLALEVVIDDDGSERLGGVWDYREDPEGIVYAGPLEESVGPLIANVQRIWGEREPARVAALGFMVQTFGPPEWHVVVRPDDHPRGLSEREQARAMGFCQECGDDRYGHTYTAACWWRSRWRQKDASW